MSLTAEDRTMVIALERQKTQALLLQVDMAQKNKMWDLVANRLYYAMFHAVSALLIYNELQVGTHRGAQIRFHQAFVKTGVFTKEEGHLYSRLQQLREEGDYNCYIQAEMDEIYPLIEKSKEMINKIFALLNDSPHQQIRD